MELHPQGAPQGQANGFENKRSSVHSSVYYQHGFGAFYCWGCI